MNHTRGESGYADAVCENIILKREMEQTMTKLSEQYLTFDNSAGLIDENLYNMIIDCFDKKYKDICDFFNYGELLKTSIVPVPEYTSMRPY